MGVEVPLMHITVVYSPKPRDVMEKMVLLEQGSSVARALAASGLVEQFPDWDVPTASLGIWGKKSTLTHVLRDLDRVEVYRALMVDPKVARRERFVGQGAKRAAGLFAKRRDGAKAGY
jgi:putative ubiquitin-RnfH superfamily antitoxin RatB of RatAB toxin-antitoxin module